MEKQSIYESITNKIVEKLKSGVVPWRASWRGVGFPRNGVTKRAYRGINSLVLALEEYNSPFWMTFKQVQSLGGKVKKGEKATSVVFWKWLRKIDEETNEEVKIPLLRQYKVFNERQCDGLKLSQPPKKITGIKACEGIIKNYLKREENLTYQDYKVQPFYLPLQDLVNIPPIEKFKSKELFYQASFHELAHTTGHSKRLDRGIEKLAPFGAKDYSKEELIAELAACFLSGIAEISLQVIDDSASYLNGWIKTLKGDSKLLIHAGAKAQHAVDYILGDKVNYEE